MLKFKTVTHPDDKPITRCYACRVNLFRDHDEEELIGSFWLVGNPGAYHLKLKLKMFETPAHFMKTEIFDLTEKDLYYVKN